MTRLARRVGGVVLPMLFLGPDLAKVVGDKTYYGMDVHGFKGQDPRQLDGSAYWVSDELFEQWVRAILTQLARARFRIVVAHGHGPSTKTFASRIDAWQREFGLRLFTCWRDDEKDGLGIQTDHAAANETSLMMALHADLVQMENLSPDPNNWPVAVSGKDPRIHASAETGERAIAMQLDRMAALLTDALAAM
jgi:creatinine amidohydrolase